MQGFRGVGLWGLGVRVFQGCWGLGFRGAGFRGIGV